MVWIMLATLAVVFVVGFRVLTSDSRRAIKRLSERLGITPMPVESMIDQFGKTPGNEFIRYLERPDEAHLQNAAQVLLIWQVCIVDGSEENLHAWHRMLRESKMLVTVVGSTDPEAACAALRRRLEGVERAYQPMPTPHFVARCEQVKDVRESEKIRQGKLVLGFRVDMRPGDPLAPAMRSFCDVFGGGPYSKLFMNVREKMSLCYYCSARFARHNSHIFIQCGCEEENMDKAVAEILHQLEIIRDGDCKAELESSRIAMIDALDGVADTPNGLENWYAARLLDDDFRTPAQVAEETRSVTVEQLQECAGRLSLDTVYRLVAEKEEVQTQ
mgnify:CR=1 FL=1